MITEVVRIIYLVAASLAFTICPQEMIPILSEFVLYCLGVSGSISDSDMQRFLEFYHTNGSGVVMYNHPTFYDFVVLAKTFGHRCRFVAFSHRLTFPANVTAWKLGTLNIRPSSGASAAITEAINMRQPSTPIITMSPTGGFTPRKISNADYKFFPYTLRMFVTPES